MGPWTKELCGQLRLSLGLGSINFGPIFSASFGVWIRLGLGSAALGLETAPYLGLVQPLGVDSTNFHEALCRRVKMALKIHPNLHVDADLK